jgi:chromosome segregation ATPase
MKLDMLSAFNKATEETQTETEKTVIETKEEPKQVSDKKETHDVDSDVEETQIDDPYAQWAKDDLISEMKKAREEAAKNRVEKNETEKLLIQAFEKKLTESEQEKENLKKKAKEFDELKEKELDNKRSLEEKIADRELKLQEMQKQIDFIQDQFRQKSVEFQSKAEKFEAKEKATKEFWNKQLDKELSEVPAKFKNIAATLVKGAGDDPIEAIDVIRNAKMVGMFGEKPKVMHQVPTAKEGARFDEKKVLEEKKASMTSREKIQAGIEEMFKK